MYSLLVAAVVGYLVGSVPSAYLLVRWRANLDIRREGSGNVGTLNSYEVTGSKAVGIAVLLLDLLKGAAASVIGRAIAPDTPFEGSAVAAVLAVVGHNYSVWLGFRGGRGLATAAGAMLSMQWALVGIWLGLWGAGYALTRDVNGGSAVAFVLVAAFVLVLPAVVIEPLLPSGATVWTMRACVVLLTGAVLTKLVDPVRDLMRRRKQDKDV